METDGQPPSDDAELDDAPANTESTLQHLWEDINEATGAFPVGAITDGLLATAVVAICMVLLVSISGLYPPLAVVSSGSMAPHIQTGDTVYMIEEARFSDATTDEAIVTYREGVDKGVKSFGSYGTVITFEPDTDFAKSVMHRPRFTVTEGENWYKKANKEYITAESCSELRKCPAPRSGYITKGDNNPHYDQALGMYGPIPSEAITGKVSIRLPTGFILDSSGSDPEPEITTAYPSEPVRPINDTEITANTTLNPNGE